jgi:hypothetical protein
MAYSENFPAQRAIFTLDAANAGRLDPRMTFTRASTANVWDGSKHLSSENLFLHSSTFDNAAWFSQGLTSRTGGQTDPSGGTSGFTLLEDSATTFHRIAQSIATNGELALTVYAKRNAGSRYLNLTIATVDTLTGAGLATFDLAGGATHTSNGVTSTLTNLSATQTASGNGYYKCVFKATATTTVSFAISLSDVATPASSNYGLVYYTGDGSSSIDVAFASLSTTGATDYQATTTQIHREYAPSLVSKANNVGRFDHTTDGQSAATSLGILIEGQSQNLVTYGIDFASWANTRTAVEANAAIGPDGTLSADLMREDNAAHGLGTHFVTSAAFTTALSTQYTMSVYAKRVAGSRLLQLRVGGIGSGKAYVNFDLGDGTVEGSGGTVLDSSSISSVGNGWHRCSLTFTNAASGSTVSSFYLALADTNIELPNYTADEYSGFALYGAQVEAGQMSSFIATTSSAVTRAAESLSVATADIGYTGGPVSLVTEFNVDAAAPVGSGVVRRFAMAQLGGTEFGLYQATYGGAALLGVAGGSILTGSSLTAGANKAAMSYDTDDVAICANGGSVTTDTSQELIDASGLNFYVGGETGGASALNGHIKRIAIFSEALSDTNLQSLTAS